MLMIFQQKLEIKTMLQSSITSKQNSEMINLIEDYKISPSMNLNRIT